MPNQPPFDGPASHTFNTLLVLASSVAPLATAAGPADSYRPLAPVPIAVGVGCLVGDLHGRCVQFCHQLQRRHFGMGHFESTFYGNFMFNQDISGWDTSAATTMNQVKETPAPLPFPSGLVRGCSRLTPRGGGCVKSAKKSYACLTRISRAISRASYANPTHIQRTSNATSNAHPTHIRRASYAHPTHIQTHIQRTSTNRVRSRRIFLLGGYSCHCVHLTGGVM